MPAARYRVLTVGPQIAQTATAPVFVSLAGIGKKALPNQPFIVANELVCSQIARSLLLPCPPGALLESGGETYFFSLDFNLAGQALPPVSPGLIAQDFPDLAWGIIVFDALVMNTDRHAHNIAHDMTSNKVQIFDHSHAWLGSSADVPGLLTRQANQLAIGGHCLANQMTNTTPLQGWLEKAKKIPDFFIEGIVEAGCTCGFATEHKTLLEDFLKHRRDNLETIFSANMAQFPKVKTP